MAKKRRHNKKRHQQDTGHQQDDFLANAPEKSAQDWSDEPEEEVNVEVENQQQEPQVVSDESMAQEEAAFQENSQENIAEENIDETVEESTPTFSLGNYLQSEREAKGINLKNVSQSTKISITNLEYLESDDLAALPDRAYVIGYVKSYSRLLGIDINFTLDLLNKTYDSLGGHHKEPQIVIPQAQNSPQMREDLPVAKIAAVAAMIVVMIGIGWFFIGRDSGPAKEVTEEAQEVVESETQEHIQPQTLNAETPLQDEISDEPVGEEATPEEDDIEAEEAKVTATPQVKKEENKPEVKKEEEKEEKEDKEEKKTDRKFYQMVMPLYEKDTTMSQERVSELLPNEFKVSPQAGIQAVFITAVKGDSWLTYKSDNDPIKKFVLREGRSLLFRAKEARVFLGNLSAVKVFLNNEPLKISSPSGVKSLVFPQEKAKEYVTPLFIYKKNGEVITSKEWIEENQP